jgi:hypothetical protein
MLEYDQRELSKIGNERISKTKKKCVFEAVMSYIVQEL